MSKSCLKSAGNNAVTSHPRPALLRNKLCVAILLAIAGPAYALPQGGQVVAGDVAIAVSGDTMDIQQNSQRAILDFHSFDIADQQTVNFHQPGADAVALNRVLGDRLSEIHGALNANGQVYLINPNGVVFGNGAEINVGSLVVTTLGMTDQDFLAGRDAFSGGAEGRIENDGSIHAQDRVVLLAPEVVNRGDIQVPDGDIVLRSSRQALLHTAGSEIPILVDDADLVGRVTNEGSLRAGEIALVLDGSGRGNVYDSAINNSGLVRAVKGSGEGGEIHLLAATGVVNSGVLDASAEQGDGGTVSIISDSINQSGSINATAAGEGKGGQIDLLASHSIAMHSGSSIDASADRAGDSGDVVVIAEKSTWLTDDATIKARGGEVSGDGGFVEVSGFEFVSIEGDVNVGANNGEGGLWYIDPTDISIVPDEMGSDVGGGFVGTNPATWSPDSPPPNSAQINVVTLRNALNNEGNVLISTASTGSGAGNITFNAVLDYNGMGATRTLTLDANSQIIFTENGGIWDSNPATVETLNFTAIAGGGISIADGGATEGSGVINAGAGKIDITAQTGDALITGLASSAAAADAIQVRAPAGSILNGGDKLWDAMTFNAAGGVILEARGDIDDIALHVNVLDASSSHGDVRLFVGAEDVNVTNTVVVNRLTVAGFAGVHTPRILNVTNASVLVGDEIQLSSELLVSLPQDGLIAQGALTLIAPDIVAANPSDPVNPSRTLTLGATDLTIDTSAAGGNLIVNSTVDTVSVINRHTNSITVTDANAITLGTINPLMGAISISSGTGSDLTVGTDLDLSNKAGSLTLGAGRDLLLNASILDTDGSGITLTAPGNVIFAADSVVNTGTGNINVTATDGNVALGALTGGAITVTAGGSIADANGSGVNLTGTSAILTAGTGAPAQASIGTATDALETSLSSLRLNSTKGGAFVENNQSLTLTEAIVTGDLALSLTAGDLTLMESAPAVTGSATFLVEAGDLILQNAGLDLSGQTLTISADAIVNDDSDVVLFAQDADITLRDAAGSVTSNFETLVLNIVGGQGYSVENTGALTLQSLSTSQNVQISSDSLVVNDIHLAGSNIALEFNTPGNLTQTGQLTSTATADNVTLDFTAGSAITVDGNLRAANGEGLNHSFNFTAETGFAMGSDAQIGAWDGGIIINAQTGDVAVTGLSSTSVAEDAIQLTATTGEIRSANASARDINVENGGFIARAQGSITDLHVESQFFQATAVTGDIFIQEATSTSALHLQALGDAHITTGNDFSVADATVLNVANLNVDAGGAFVIADAGLDINGDLTVVADTVRDDNANISLRAVNADITLRDIGTQSRTWTTAFDQLVLAVAGTGELTITDANALDLTSVSATGNLNITTSDGSLTVGTATLGGNTELTATDGDVVLTSAPAVTGNLSLITQGSGDVILPDGGISIGGDLTVDAEDLRDADGDTDLTLAAANANITLRDGSAAREWNTSFDQLVLAITGTGDFTLTNTDSLVLTSVTTGGNANVSTNTGNLTVGVGTIDGNASFTAGGSLALASLTIDGDADFTAASGDINFDTGTIGGSAAFTSTDGNITLANAPTVDGDLSLTTVGAGDVILPDGGISIGGDLTVDAEDLRDADGDADLTLVATNANITLRDGSAAREWNTSFDQLVLAITGTGDFTLTNTDSLVLTSVTTGGNANISTNTGNLTVGAGTIDGNASFTAGGSLALASLTIDGDADFTAANGGISFGAGTLGGNTAFTATNGDVVLTNAPTITGDLSLTTIGSGDVILADAGINIGGDLTVDADDLRDADGDTDLTLAAANANIILRNGSADRTWNTSFDQLVLAITGTGDLTLTNTGALVLTSVTTGGNANISTNTGNLTVGAGAIDGNASFTAGGNLALASLTIDGDADFTAANGGISFDTGTIGGSAAFTSTDGNITLANAPTVGSDLSLTTVGAGDVILPDGGISIGGDLTVDAEDLRDADGDTDLTLAAANANITLRDGSAAREWNTSFDELVLAIAGTGDFTLTNTGALTLTSVTTGGNASFSTSTGDLTVSAGAIDGNASFTSAGSLALASLTIDGDADFTAASGGISFGTGTIGGNAAFISTDGNITLSNAAAVGSNLSLTTVGAGDVILPDGGISIGGDLTVDAEDLRDADGDTDLTLAAANANIILRNGSADRTWNTSFTALVLDITGTGDFTLTDTDSLVLTSVTTGGSASFTAAGDLTFTAGSIDGDAAFTTTAGDITLLDSPTLGGDLSLTTAGSGDVIVPVMGLTVDGELTIAANNLRDADGGTDLTLAATNANITLRDGSAAREWNTSFDQLVLDITGTGDFTLTDTDSLTLTSVTTGGNASFRSTNADLMVVSEPVVAGALSLITDGSGDLILPTTGLTHNGDLTVTADRVMAGDGDVRLAAARLSATLRDQQQAANWLTSTNRFDLNLTGGGAFNLTNTGALRVDSLVSDGLVNVAIEGDLQIGSVTGTTDMAFSGADIALLESDYSIDGELSLSAANQLQLAAAGLTVPEALRLHASTLNAAGGGPVILAADTADLTLTGNQALALMTRLSQLGLTYHADTLSINNDRDLALTRWDAANLAHLSLTASGTLTIPAAGLAASQRLNIDAVDLLDGDRSLTLSAPELAVRLSNAGGDHDWTVDADVLDVLLRGQANLSVLAADGLRLADLNGDANAVMVENGNFSLVLSSGDLILAGNVSAADLSADGERSGVIDLQIEEGGVRTSGPVVVSSTNTVDQAAGTEGDAYGIRIRLTDTGATERSIVLGDETGAATLRAFGGDVLLDTRPASTAAGAVRKLVQRFDSVIEVYNNPGDAPTGQVLLNGEPVTAQAWQTVRENRLLAIVSDVATQDPGTILDELDDFDDHTNIVQEPDSSGPLAADQFVQVFGTCDELDQKNQHRCRVDAALKSFLSHWLVGGEMPPKSEIR